MRRKDTFYPWCLFISVIEFHGEMIGKLRQQRRCKGKGAGLRIAPRTPPKSLFAEGQMTGERLESWEKKRIHRKAFSVLRAERDAAE